MSAVSVVIFKVLLSMANIAVGTWLATWMVLREESHVVGWMLVVGNAMVAAYNISRVVALVAKCTL